MGEFTNLLNEYYELRSILEQIYDAVEDGRDIQFGDVVYTLKKPKSKVRISINEEALCEVMNNPAIRAEIDKAAQRIADKAGGGQ